MSLKPVLIAVGLVLLAQVLIFNYFQHENILILDKAMSNLEGQYIQLENEKNILLAKHRQLKAFLESTPPQYRPELVDARNKNVEFLDCDRPDAETPGDARLMEDAPGLPLASLKIDVSHVKGP